MSSHDARWRVLRFTVLAAALLGCGEPEWFEDVSDRIARDVDVSPPQGYRVLAERMGGGVCVLDADGAAPLDLVFAVSDGVRLLVASSDGGYVDQTSRIERAPTAAAGCLAFDVEGDGDDDLFLSGVGAIRLYLQDAGTFRDVSSSIVGEIGASTLYTSMAAGDLDLDGDLDVVVGGFMDFGVPPDHPCTPIDCAGSLGAFPPAASLLFVREDDGTYVERSETLAPDLRLPEPTLSVAIARVGGASGAPDIFVGNDLGNAFQDRVLRRDADGVYRDVAPAIGLARDARTLGVDTMGWTTGDVDGNGVLDYAGANFEGIPTALYLCESDTSCTERGDDLGLYTTQDTVRWGPAMADFDLDGDVDLAESAGHVYPVDELRAFGSESDLLQPSALYENHGGELRHVEVSALEVPRHLRGLAVFDLDDDGRPDLVFAPATGRPLLVRNVRPPVGHWLRVILRGRGANRAAAGAVVRVMAGDFSAVRARSVGEGYSGSFDPRLHFGVPTSDRVSVEVQWASGARTTATDVAVDREIVIEESP